MNMVFRFFLIIMRSMSLTVPLGAFLFTVGRRSHPDPRRRHLPVEGVLCHAAVLVIVMRRHAVQVEAGTRRSDVQTKTRVGGTQFGSEIGREVRLLRRKHDI